MVLSGVLPPAWRLPVVQWSDCLSEPQAGVVIHGAFEQSAVVIQGDEGETLCQRRPLEYRMGRERVYAVDSVAADLALFVRFLNVLVEAVGPEEQVGGPSSVWCTFHMARSLQPPHTHRNLQVAGNELEEAARHIQRQVEVHD